MFHVFRHPILPADLVTGLDLEQENVTWFLFDSPIYRIKYDFSCVANMLSTDKCVSVMRSDGLGAEEHESG